MDYITLHHYFKRSVLCALFPAIVCTSTIRLEAAFSPFQAYQAYNEASFIAKLEKLVDKLTNSQDKGEEKCIGYLLQIKKEIEKFTGKRIHIDDYMESLQKDLSKYGFHDESQLKAVRDKIKYYGKKRHKSAKSVDGVGSFKEQEKKPTPGALIFGVSMALCGFFLMNLRNPACYVWGERLVMSGFTTCGISLAKEYDENNKK